MRGLLVAGAMAIMVATFSGLSAAADALPVHNLQLDQWDAERIRPEGWRIGEVTGYKSGADCEARAGRCVLRFQSVEGSTPSVGFIPLVQSMPSSTVAGRGLRLSGWIRTQDVKGWAGLWMRVDA